MCSVRVFELGSAGVEERDARLLSDCSSQHSLACSRRAREENALVGTTTEDGELGRVLDCV